MQGKNHITILMAVRNGAAFLPAQLASIAAQTHTDWTLVLSDDGSRDDSMALGHAFAAQLPDGQVRMINGPQRGATANFLHLIDAAQPGGMIAFCDQDDVWLPEKLARAAAMLGDLPGPAMYSARTLICDAGLNVLTESPRFRRGFGLRNALVQACTAGNTCVFNADAAAILKTAAALADRAGVISHEWWAYQLIAGAGGAVLKDDHPVLKYRQHGENEMGRNDTFRERLRRLGMLFDGSFGGWLAANQRALTDAADLLTPANRDVIKRFGAALSASGPAAAAEFARLGLYRHETMGTAALYAAAAAGRLRRRPAR